METSPRQIRVSREWLRLLAELPAAGRVVVIGPSDSGKTTLCRWLVAKLQERAPTAWVDADLGQSQVGPPGCVGWRLAGRQEYEFLFVGDVTPATNPTAALTATVRAVHDAEAAGARSVVVDTTGYLQGPDALALKSAKLELLEPLHLLALGDSPAVKRLLAAWHRDERVTVQRLPMAEALRQKTQAERSQWRRDLFAEYFAGCDLHRIPLQGLALSGLPTATELRETGRDWNSLGGLLLGFHDAARRGLTLGLLYQLDLRVPELLARTRAVAEQACGVAFGAIRLREDGTPMA